MDYANKLGIPFTMFIGETELKSKKFKLKNMISGEEKTVNAKDAAKLISQ